MSERRFVDRETLDEELANTISGRLRDGIGQNGGAHLVVSGGSTPRGLFACLSRKPLDWSAVTVLPADERYVPANHPDSNEKLVRTHLLTGEASAARFVSLAPGDADNPDPKADLARIHSALAGIPAFDVVVLGMGGDGHTASLFPCAPELQEGLTTSADALMTTPATAPHRRVSLSLGRLRRTRSGVIHIVGEDKLRVLKEARATADTRRFPVFAVLGEPGFEVWYAG